MAPTNISEETFDRLCAPPQRSMASERARRTRASVSGAFWKLTSTLSFTFESASTIISFGVPRLAFSALVLFHPLPATSS